MYKKILVAFDIAHREHGIKILKRAQQLCDYNGELKVIYVGEDIPGYMDFAIPQDILDEGMENLRKSLKKIVSDHKIQAGIVIRRGRPHVKILEYAKTMNADLIVSASHNPGIQDFLIGSTTARIVRHAQCSVLVDRDEAH